MEREITIALRFKLAIGDVTLNDIVYRLKVLRDDLMLRILAEILRGYDDLICERLTQTRIYPRFLFWKAVPLRSHRIPLRREEPLNPWD